MIEGLENAMKVKFPAKIDSEDTRKMLEELCLKYNVEVKKPRTITRMIDKLVGEFLEANCKDPTFIMEHPQIMSPLAKYHRSKPELTERFELFVNCKEIVNAYTELNDPKFQKDCFAQEMEVCLLWDINFQARAQGDDEAQQKLARQLDDNFRNTVTDAINLFEKETTLTIDVSTVRPSFIFYQKGCEATLPESDLTDFNDAQVYGY